MRAKVLTASGTACVNPLERHGLAEWPSLILRVTVCQNTLGRALSLSPLYVWRVTPCCVFGESLSRVIFPVVREMALVSTTPMLASLQSYKTHTNSSQNISNEKYDEYSQWNYETIDLTMLEYMLEKHSILNFSKLVTIKPMHSGPGIDFRRKKIITPELFLQAT